MSCYILIVLSRPNSKMLSVFSSQNNDTQQYVFKKSNLTIVQTSEAESMKHISK